MFSYAVLRQAFSATVASRAVVCSNSAVSFRRTCVPIVAPIPVAKNK